MPTAWQLSSNALRVLGDCTQKNQRAGDAPGWLSTETVQDYRDLTKLICNQLFAAQDQEVSIKVQG